MHLIEVGGDDVPILPHLLPVARSAQVCLLVGDLLGGAVAGLGHRPDEVRPPLFHPLLGLPGGVVVVQQLGEGLTAGQFHFGAILQNGQEGEVHLLPLFFQHHRLILALQDDGAQPQHLPGQALGSLVGPEGQFPGHQGGNPAEGVQQPLVLALSLGRLARHQLLQLLLPHGGEVQLARGHGVLVEEAGHHRALGGDIPVHPAHAVGDAPRPVQHNEVGLAADALQHQGPLHPVPQLTEGLKAELQQPLHGGLANLQNAAAQKILAQQHTEHGGRLRVLPGHSGELGSGMGGVCRQQQLHISLPGAHVQHHLIPGGLIDLVHLSAGDAFPQLSG